MDKRLQQLTRSGIKLSIILLVIFAIVSAFYNPLIAVIEGAAILLLLLYNVALTRRRAADIRKYVEDLTFQVDDTGKNTMANFPLPMLIARLDTDEIVWCNQHFTRIADPKKSFFDSGIRDALPGFDTKWLLEGKPVCPHELELNGRKYNVYGNIVRSNDKNNGRSLLSSLFFVDVTDYSELRVKSENQRPVVSIITIDSYEELFKDMKDSDLSALSASIDRMITDWCESTHGILRKTAQNRYLFIFEQKELLEFTASKFPILEDMKALKNSAGVTASLSIGIGKGDLNLQELYDNAAMALEMALSRGGDQVVIKSQKSFEFYGGREKEVEKRTKVKSRVIANAMRQLINDSSHVFITGHKVSDLDSVGACAGICAAVRKCGKTPYMVIDTEHTSSNLFINKLLELTEYQGTFISEEEAVMLLDASSLLIVCDTSRPELVDCPNLLQSASRVMVIDHHRRAASYIENPALSMFEPSASSASELVSELLQYVVSPKDVLKAEANGLMAGMYLDTKNFTVHTGVRTFEAAAYLRQLGADTTEVRKLFSEDLDAYVDKSHIISSAYQPMPGIVVSVCDRQVGRAAAAQAADELLNVNDTVASFVIYSESDGCSISARSYGQPNVQIIMEKMGGGGSLTGAGAQFPGKTPTETVPLLMQTITEYMNEDAQQKQEGKNAK